MISHHLSEDEIQQYVLDRDGCPQATIEHMEICSQCGIQAANYKILFTEIKLAPLPDMEMDLAGLVLPQLPAERRPRIKDRSFSLLLVIAGGLTLVPCWLFRRSFLSLLGTVPYFALYVMAGVALIIMVVRIIGMVKDFQRKLEDLKFS